MGAALNAAVHDNIYFVTDRIDDLGQLVKRASRPIELPSAMVGQDNASTADIHGLFCIL